DSSNNAIQGSGRTVNVSFTVNAPCSLQLASNALSFTVAQGQSAPPASQTVGITEGGSCVYPVSFAASGDSNSSSWLGVSLTSKTDTNGSGSSAVISILSTTLAPGTYKGTVSVSASGNGGAGVVGSPHSITVTLKVTGFTVSGSVVACTDSTCASPVALPGAALVLKASTGSTVTTITADSSGNFSFRGIGSGTYTVVITGSISSTNYGATISLTVNGNQTNVVFKTSPV
ncbi:MAG: carboxypeptidase-like regulatory domain-containing protein, partial [Chloroflexota bacterium]|nr:carboxypeptidase-like regulatory domain-containing protein [Chloroflexota bacterium]